MQRKSTDTFVDVEILDEETPQQPQFSVKDLQQAYNATKVEDTKDTSKLTNNFTLKGLDEVKELVATAMVQIDELANKGKEESVASSFTGKALAVIPGGSKLSTWLGVKQDQLKIEEIQQKSISEVIETLRSAIETKREEVIVIIEDLSAIRENMIGRLSTYEDIDKKVSTIVQTAASNTREMLDAQLLGAMVKQTIEKLHSDVKSMIEPLIAAATVSVQQIQALLPTIENDLQNKMSIKVVQQQLQDLNQMTQEVTNLAASAGARIKDSVHQTIYSSLELLSNTGLDVKQLEQNAQDEIKHQEKMQQIMKKTQQTIEENYRKIDTLQLGLAEKRKSLENSLISQYSATTTLKAGA